MPTSRRSHYCSYLLRIWQEADGELWRGSLHSVQDDTTFYFANLEALAVFLLGRPDTTAHPTGDDSPDGDGASISHSADGS